jgi:ubiquinone/menaquinone biosynthesis C-methylase UbiE
MSDQYKQGLESDKNKFEDYFRKSVVKTEQQKFLESLLVSGSTERLKVADIACGGGTLSYHLYSFFPNSDFVLVDYLEDALGIAKDVNKDRAGFTYQQDNIYTLATQPDNKFDYTFCWQTLSWLDDPESALNQLVRITKPGGMIYMSSLFNLDHEVDVFSKVYDLTRESGANRIPYSYNTYSSVTINSWLKGKVKEVKFYPFVPSIDFNYDGKGIGTSTVKTAEGKRLQLSAGMLLNWAILTIKK